MKAGSGTTPRGVPDERGASQWVQNMFAEVAPRYDFLNHLLSLGIDRGWRRALAKELAPILSRKDVRVLDLCCGTGDVLLDLQKIARAPIMGADFCHPMLVAARRKTIRGDSAPAPLFEADALALPVPNATLDAISIAFGFRNLTNYAAGLTEMSRVLKPGGVLAVLEFSHPPGFFMKSAYGFYSRFVLPTIGALVSGSRSAYTYLPESVQRFPTANELVTMMEQAGFAQPRFSLLTGGIAALHIGTKS